MEYYDDEELLYLSRCGHEVALELLIDGYYHKIKQWVYPYYKSGCFTCDYDLDDLVQMLMSAVVVSLDAYRDDQGATIYTFLKLVVKRRMSSLLSSSKNKQKFYRLGNIALDAFINNDSSSCRYEEIVEDPHVLYRPEKQLVVKETKAAYTTQLEQNASLIEKQVILYLSEGYSQKEIAKLLNISIKSVYNAAYRGHRKLEPLTSKNKYDKL